MLSTRINETNHVTTTFRQAAFVLATLLSFATVLGNVFVIAIGCLNRKLARKPTTALLLNLAGADLMVGGIIMPLGAVQIRDGGVWLYGWELCRVWASLDVICCSASILTLCMISLDRFIGVTRPLRYCILVTRNRLVLSNIFVWTLSSLILLCTVRWEAGSYQPSNQTKITAKFASPGHRVEYNYTYQMDGMPTYQLTNYTKFANIDQRARECSVANELRYVVPSTVFSFYIPLMIILLVYIRIFRITQQRQNLLRSLTAPSSDVAKTNTVKRKCKDNNNRKITGPRPNATQRSGPQSYYSLRVHCGGGTDEASRQQRNYQQQAKSAKTLSLVVGAFLICWFPFFTLYLTSVVCESCVPPLFLESLTWFGYANSTLNPIIYAITMRSFRQSFMTMISSRSKKPSISISNNNNISRCGYTPICLAPILSFLQGRVDPVNCQNSSLDSISMPDVARHRSVLASSIGRTKSCCSNNDHSLEEMPTDSTTSRFSSFRLSTRYRSIRRIESRIKHGHVPQTGRKSDKIQHTKMETNCTHNLLSVRKCSEGSNSRNAISKFNGEARSKILEKRLSLSDNSIAAAKYALDSKLKLPTDPQILLKCNNSSENVGIPESPSWMNLKLYRLLISTKVTEV